MVHWLNDHVHDTYVKLAKKEGYRARAAYKLKEIDEVFHLIHPGDLVVDLGSTPGAWSQYVRRRLSPNGAATGALNGHIVALDSLPMEPVDGVHFILREFNRHIGHQGPDHTHNRFVTGNAVHGHHK